MESEIKKVLVIGGGFTGMSVALALNQLGVEVDLVEINPNWRTDGAGITVSGPSIRAIDALGLRGVFLEQGTMHNAFEGFNAQGHKMMEIPPLPVPRTDIVGGGGIMRPNFARAIAGIVRSRNISVRLGETFREIHDGEDQAHVIFENGTEDDYDLVIAADGVYSSVRERYFPGAPVPEYSGQGVWRAVVPRNGLQNAMQFLGRDSKAGFTPVSADHMYLYFTEKRPTKARIPDDQLLPTLRALLEEYTAPLMVQIREGLNEQSQILYRPLEQMLMPRPWYRGRILLIGDAVHATTPHLASGAGMGFEDAVVFGEEVARGGDLHSILERYQNRRWTRCAMVVNNSGRLGQIEINGGPWEEHGQIIALSMTSLLAPY
jgi:2-polyprenyl-6-methoxyphenol hydroxylase-like FAD-dependent oxidoreductase